MYNEKIEALISAALADGKLTEKEKQILFKKAQAQGIDLDEFEMVLDARLVELEKAEKAKAAVSAPKSTKYGDIRKCPVCGAMVPALAAVCPECGFEFSGIDANISSKKLADLLLDVSDIDKKEEIIITFPIPNTKADLFEFLSALQPRMRDINDPLSSAYFKKYQECINKAKISFANDSHLSQFINTFEQEAKSLKHKHLRRNIFNWCKGHKWWIIAIIWIFIILISLVFESIPTTSNDAKKCKKAIQVALEKNDLNEVASLFVEFDGSKKEIGAIAEEVVLKCIESNQISIAEQINSYYPSYTDQVLIDYYLQQELFNKVLEKGNEYTMGSLMKECVTYLCEKGRKKEAYQFVKKNSDKIHEWSDGSGSQDKLVNGRGVTRKKIVNYLNEYIRNY